MTHNELQWATNYDGMQGRWNKVKIPAMSKNEDKKKKEKNQGDKFVDKQ